MAAPARRVGFVSWDLTFGPSGVQDNPFDAPLHPGPSQRAHADESAFCWLALAECAPMTSWHRRGAPPSSLGGVGSMG